MVLLIITGACREYQGVTIAGNVLPSDGDCLIEATDNVAQLFRGTLNVDFPDGYEIFPLIQNQIRGLPSDISADPSILQAANAEVKLQASDGSLIAFDGLPNPFDTILGSYSSGSATSSGGTVSPGFGTGVITIVPDAYREQLPTTGTLVARIKLDGKTLGGQDVRSNEYTWTISLCGGSCLFSCVPPDDTNPEEAISCTPGQDRRSTVNCVQNDAGERVPPFLR